MATVKQNKKRTTWDSLDETPEIMEKGLPKDEEFQAKKEARRKTADDVTDYLAQKGWPTLGAIAGTATDISADFMPGSRQEFLENIGSGTMGTTGKVTKTQSQWLQGLGRIETPSLRVDPASVQKMSKAGPQASKLAEPQVQPVKWPQAETTSVQQNKILEKLKMPSSKK